MSESPSEKADSRSSPILGAIGWFLRNAISWLFVAFAVLCVYNVYGVGPEVETMAKEITCRGQTPPCTARYTKAERTPWAHTFQMYTSASSGERSIWCQRQYILVGDYACHFKGDLAEPIPSGYPSAFVKVVPAPSVSARPRSTSTSAPARFSPKPSVAPAPSAAPALSAAPSNP